MAPGRGTGSGVEGSEDNLGSLEVPVRVQRSQVVLFSTHLQYTSRFERGGEGIKESMNLDIKSRDDDTVTTLLSTSKST